MENLIRKLAWQYARQAFNSGINLDFEELQAEANLAYLEALRNYDESKGRVTTYVWHTVSGRLKTYLKEEYAHHLMPLDEEELPQSAPSYLDKLSEDAQAIAKIIVNSPNELFAMTSAEAKMKIFVKMLNDKYPLQKIINGFKELSNIYASN